MSLGQFHFGFLGFLIFPRSSASTGSICSSTSARTSSGIVGDGFGRDGLGIHVRAMQEIVTVPAEAGNQPLFSGFLAPKKTSKNFAESGERSFPPRVGRRSCCS